MRECWPLLMELRTSIVLALRILSMLCGTFVAPVAVGYGFFTGNRRCLGLWVRAGGMSRRTGRPRFAWLGLALLCCAVGGLACGCFRLARCAMSLS